MTALLPNLLHRSYKRASIAAKNDYFGDAVSHASAAFRQAAAAAAIEDIKRRNKKMKIHHFLLRRPIAAPRRRRESTVVEMATAAPQWRSAAIESATGALLRHSSIAALPQ